MELGGFREPRGRTPRFRALALRFPGTGETGVSGSATGGRRVMKHLIVWIGILALLSACAPPMGHREGAGTLIGAGSGALLGAQIGSGQGRLVATAAGALIGALAGQDIGRSLDRADQAHVERSSQSAMEYSATHRPTTWVNPDTGATGTVTPTRTYRDAGGRYCREFTQTVQIDGQNVQAYGTACRQPDGTWQLISRQTEAPAQEVVIRERVVAPQYYHSGYYPGYYPYYGSYYPYYRPYFWPFASSLSFSWVHRSGGHHHGHGGRHGGRHGGWHR
jgi:surface antigen